MNRDQRLGFRSPRATCAWRPRRTWSWSAAVPAGMSAAIAAARNGAEVTLLERYNHLGGLASGGMVLVLDDMWDSHLQEISVRGICIDDDRAHGGARPGDVSAPARMGRRCPAAYRSAGRAGARSTSTARRRRTRSASPRRSIPTAGSASRSRWWQQLGIELRLHSWFSRTLVEDGQVKGVICETKSGREAILGRRRHRRDRRPRRRRLGRRAAHRRHLHHDDGVSPRRRRHRRGRALRSARSPRRFAALDREIKRMLGGCVGATGG